MKVAAIPRRRFLAGGGAVVGAVAFAGQGASASVPASSPSVDYRATPVLDTVDVLVVGGGPAGIGAALAAKRQGVRCLLVESYSFFGGSAVWGLGKPMEQMRPDSKPRSVIHEDVLKHLTALGDQAARIEGHRVFPHVHFLKAAIVDTLDTTGCPYLVHVQAVDTLVDGNRVTGVVLATKQGMHRVHADVVVDCTGDAAIASFAGAPPLSEGAASGPMGLAAAFVDIDVSSVRDQDVTDAMDDNRGQFPLLPNTIRGLRQVANARFAYLDHRGAEGFDPLDPLDPIQRSKAECLGRRQVLQMEHAMRESSAAALQDIDLCEGAPQVTVPTPRRVKGVYTLTRQDVEGEAVFSDTIALRCDIAGEVPTGCGIPYRTLIPEELDNVLITGTGLSAEPGAGSAAAGNSMATGHAAGVAAAIAVNEGITPRRVDVRAIRDRLKADGVPLPLSRRART